MNEPWMYIVLLGMVIVVLSYLAPKQQSAAGAPQMGRELEEAMDQFIAEIEADNKELLKTVAQMKKDHDQSLARLAKRVEELGKQIRTQESELKRIALLKLEEWKTGVEGGPAANPPHSPLPEQNTALPQESSAASEEPPVSGKTSANIRERYGELFRLYDEGKSVETIAKKIGMNKGEVTLILQLAKQEDS